ncbi:DNA repair helicase UVH6, partial [Durusdinium trenchii]
QDDGRLTGGHTGRQEPVHGRLALEGNFAVSSVVDCIMDHYFHGSNQVEDTTTPEWKEAVSLILEVLRRCAESVSSIEDKVIPKILENLELWRPAWAQQRAAWAAEIFFNNALGKEPVPFRIWMSMLHQKGKAFLDLCESFLAVAPGSYQELMEHLCNELAGGDGLNRGDAIRAIGSLASKQDKKVMIQLRRYLGRADFILIREGPHYLLAALEVLHSLNGHEDDEKPWKSPATPAHFKLMKALAKRLTKTGSKSYSSPLLNLSLALTEEVGADELPSQALLGAVDPSSVPSRLTALELLCQTSAHSTQVEVCLRLLEDPDLRVKSAALDAMRFCGSDPDRADLLGQKALEHLHHWDHFVRRAALALLREAVQTEETIEALLTLLEDPSSEVVCRAIVAIAELDRGPKDETPEAAEEHETKLCGALAPLLEHGDVAWQLLLWHKCLAHGSLRGICCYNGLCGRS